MLHRIATLALLAVFSAGSIIPQTPSAADPVIRVSVDLVQVDAVVTDSTGKHVPNLSAQDFEIFEDGKAQRITHFSFIGPQSAAAPPASPGLKKNPVPPAGVAPSPLRREQIARSIVLFVDDLGLSAQQINRVKKALRDFVDRGMQPGDLVSVITPTGAIGAAGQFSNDKVQLHAAIDRIHWIPRRAGLSPFQAFSDGDPSNARKTAAIRAQLADAASALDQVVSAGTLAGVRYAVQGLRDLPGRKGLMIVSEGIGSSPDVRVRDLMDEATRAGVVLYTIDARGIVTTGFTAEDDVHATPYNPGGHLLSVEGGRARGYENSKNLMERLARETGGLFLGSETNDLSAALSGIAGDLGSYYLIGYQPQRQEDSRQFHRIEIKVKPAGLRVRSPSGYFGSPELVLPSIPASRTELLRDALYRPFQGDLRVRLQALYTPADGKTAAILRGRLVIDANGLTFAEQADGRRKATLDIVGAAFNAEGKMISNRDQTYNISLTAEELRDTLAAGFFYEMIIPLEKAGGVQFRAALRDVPSGRTGSAATWLNVPDFNRRSLSLSSLDLGVAPSFQPGAAIEFACAVRGAHLDKAGSPKIDFQIQLFRGAEQIYTGPVIPMPQQDPQKGLVLTGSMRLPDTLPPGEYAMEVTAHDRLAPEKSQEATQWAMFSLRTQ